MLNVKLAGGIGGVALLALFYSSTLGLLTIIGLMAAVIFDLWQDLLKAEANAKISSGQAKDAIRKESAQKTELATIATVQKEANALIQQMKLDHKKEKEVLLEKIAELEKKPPPSKTPETVSKSAKAERELSSQLTQALQNLEQIKRQRQEEQEKSKERLLSLEQQLREALAKESTHKDELERILVLAIQEKKAVAEAKDDVIEKQQQALQVLAKEKDKIMNDSLNERQEVIAEALRERNILEGQKDELEKIVHSLQAKIRKLETNQSSSISDGAASPALSADPDADYDIVAKLQSLTEAVTSLTAERDSLRKRLSQMEDQQSAEVERILTIAVQERDQIARNYQKKKQQEDDRHRAEVERILTLAIQESDRLKADRDRLRALNETLLKKFASSSTTTTTSTTSQSTSPLNSSQTSENNNNNSTEGFSEDALRNELLNTKNIHTTSSSTSSKS